MIKSANLVNWSVQGSPIVERGSLPRSRSDAPAWLRAVWALRGEILYANGRRPTFRTADGHYSDFDPLDYLACHALAHEHGKLIGCIRFLPLGCNQTFTERILGPEKLENTLQILGVKKLQVAEASRWVVHPCMRGSAVGMRLVAAIWALCLVYNFKMIMATVGTADGQDVMLRRSGLRYIEQLSCVASEEYSDRLCFMHGVVGKPNANFSTLTTEMKGILAPHRSAGGN